MRRIVTLVATCTLLLAACGGDDSTQPAGGGRQEDSGDTAVATLAVANSSLGDILVDSEGMTLYMFMPDQEKNGRPTCYDECADAWPAFEAMGDLTAGEGLDQSLLGSVERTDGTDQVTYNDLPLYHFSGDEATADTNGQGLQDVWWVVSPEGMPVREKATGTQDDGDTDY